MGGCVTTYKEGMGYPAFGGVPPNIGNTKQSTVTSQTIRHTQMIQPLQKENCINVVASQVIPNRHQSGVGKRQALPVVNNNSISGLHERNVQASEISAHTDPGNYVNRKVLDLQPTFETRHVL